MSLIEIIRTQPQGYKVEDIHRYRVQVLKAVANTVGEWVCWQAGVSAYPKNLFDPGEWIDLQWKPIDCIYEDGFPRYWRKEWLSECLEDWKGQLPAARFLPLDLVPTQERSCLLPPTSSKNNPRPRENSNRSNPLSTASIRFYEQDHAHISAVLSRTPHTKQMSISPGSCPDLTCTSSAPSVSILMSIYNMKDSVGWSIRSVLAQTFQDW